MPEQSLRSWRLPLMILGFAVVSLVMAATILFANQPPDPTATRPARVPASGANAAVGWQPPDFEVQLLDDETRTIRDYQGQVVFLNFWATWCVPCQREMPAFETLMAEGRDDVTVLAVNHGEQLSTIRDFRRVFQLDALPIVLDPDYVISDGFGVINLPVTYILNPDGVVTGFHLGEITREDIDAYITDAQKSL
jgi:thiol-disulfide isomerase/thioredoxin